MGFTSEGKVLALQTDLYCNAGCSLDLSGSVSDRALFHSENSYKIPNMRVTAHVCRTNLPSNTAFRGFGGPQGMLATEQVLDEIARHLGMDALDVRRRNFYQPGVRDVSISLQRQSDTSIQNILPATIAAN